MYFYLIDLVLYMFAVTMQSRALVVMSSQGQLYIQPMDQSTSADHGPFYLTCPLTVDHPSLQVRLSD